MSQFFIPMCLATIPSLTVALQVHMFMYYYNLLFVYICRVAKDKAAAKKKSKLLTAQKVIIVSVYVDGHLCVDWNVEQGKGEIPVISKLLAVYTHGHSNWFPLFLILMFSGPCGQLVMCEISVVAGGTEGSAV